MNLTSVDPPEVIRFVKQHYPEVELIKPKMSIYDMAKKKGCLPTRHVRWCCEEFKEKFGADKVTLIGIRREESSRRAKRSEVEMRSRKFSGSFDQWSEHHEKMVTCVGGKDKILVSPILHWTSRDVWEFLNSNGIPHCSLYDKGYKRIGCILCPMSGHKQKVREIRDFPYVKTNWIKAIEWLRENKWTDTSLSEDSEMAFNWWISGKSFKQFYADEYLQQKIDFENVK
jgi:phosphoadenosine phosphosulfate reductase